MKVSRLGIKMYELADPLPVGDGTGHVVNALRVELNKIAEILDEIDERIGNLERGMDVADRL